MRRGGAREAPHTAAVAGLFASPLFSATTRGLSELAELLERTGMPEPNRKRLGSYPHPRSWRFRPLRWLEPIDEGDEEWAKLWQELRRHLCSQEDGIQRSVKADQPVLIWLAACAIYPAVRWDLSVYLALGLTPDGKLRDPAQPSLSLYDEAAAVRLTELPWFREGHMPDWLRIRLVRTLDPSTRRVVVKLLEVLLEDARDANSEGFSGVSLSIARDRLPYPAQHPLQDQVFLDAMARHGDLALEATRNIREMLGRMTQSFWFREWVIGSVLALHIVAAAILAPWPIDGPLHSGAWLPVTALLLGVLTWPIAVRVAGFTQARKRVLGSILERFGRVFRDWHAEVRQRGGALQQAMLAEHGFIGSLRHGLSLRIWWEVWRRFHFFPWFRLTVGALCLAGLIGLLFVPQFLPWVSRFEHATADWRTALLSDRLPGPHPGIAVVTINRATLRDYANSPIDRGLLARTVAAIDAAGADVIGLDIYFLKATDPQKDQALVDALKSAKAKIVLGAWDERGQMEEFQRDFQKAFIARIGHPAGYFNLRHERDDVVRYRASPHSGSAYPESLSRLLARAAGHDGADSERPIAWLLPPSNGAQTFVTLPAHTFVAGEHRLSAAAAAEAAKPLAGKIVLVGGDFPERDKHRTPLSAWSGESMSGVFIHGNMIADLLDPRRSIAELPPAVAHNLVAAVALVSCVIGWMLWQSSIVQYLGYTFATGVLVMVDAYVYREFRLLLPITLILAAWFLGVTGGRAIRYFVHWIRNTA